MGNIPTIAYVTTRKGGRWELRQARTTDRGPRSRTLASFGVLTPEVIRLARRRSERPLTEAEIRRAARRAGAPVAKEAASAAAATLLAELAAGRSPPPPVMRILAEALPGSDEGPTEPERAVAPWLVATPEERGDALRDLLLLADRLPTPRRPSVLSFPRIESSAA